VLGLGAVAHHPLHVGAVVPAAVEQHDLPGGRQVRDVPLEVPLRGLPLGRLGKGHHPDDAGAGALGDGLDDAPLAGRPASLEDDQHLEATGLHPVLQQHQLLLQAGDLLVVDAATQPALAVVPLRVAFPGAGGDVVGALGERSMLAHPVILHAAPVRSRPPGVEWTP
jgi:hypothetical protein